MSRVSAPIEPELEQEVDLSRFWWRIAARWWLVAAGVALGIALGYLASLGGGAVFEASATMYLGQPLALNQSTQLQGLQTDPAAVNQIVKSRSVVLEVASEVGMPPDQLRRGTSTRAIAGARQRVAEAQLVEITVRSSSRRQSADAANLLAGTAVERLATLADSKIEQYRELLASQERELATAEQAVERYRAALASEATLSPSEQLVLISLLNSAELQRGELVAQRTETELSLALATDIERPQIVTRAAATKVDARSRRTSMIVGAVIGLVAGVGAALLWDPVRRRLTRSEA